MFLQQQKMYVEFTRFGGNFLPSNSAWGRVRHFQRLCPPATSVVSQGLSGCLASDLSRLESIKVGNIPVSPLELWPLVLLERPNLPRSATMHSVKTSHCLPNVGFHGTFLVV